MNDSVSFNKSGQMAKAKHRLLQSLRDQVSDGRVISAMDRISREAFVLDESVNMAYEDIALPIGERQTISQPYIAAFMISALNLRRTDRVLEIGTGSGYQTAILAQLASMVISVERIASLAVSARQRLKSLEYTNVEIHLTGTQLGWPEAAPYDAIIVSAGAPRLPGKLMEQMGIGGRLIIPVGSHESQELMKVTRTEKGFSVHTLISCRFVPLIGEEAWPENTLDVPDSEAV